jgi:hypothetical protein
VHRRAQRQVATGRVAADEELLGVEADFTRMGDEPAHRVDAFLDRLRELGFWRTRVVDADHHDAGALGVLAHQPVVRVDAEQHEAAAVDVEEGAGHAAFLRVVGADQHLAMARGHPLLGRAFHHRTAGRPGGAHLFGDLAAFGDRHRVAARELGSVGAHALHEKLDLRVERRGLGAVGRCGEGGVEMAHVFVCDE